MARYGQVLLRQLTFQYCDRMGCAAGMREYIQTMLPAFAQQHPHVKIAAVQKRNRFPLVKAEYGPLPHDAAHLRRSIQRQEDPQLMQQYLEQRQKAGRKLEGAQPSSNVVGVKSRSAADIQEVVWWLSQSQNRPRTSRIPARHMFSRNRSIQGPWTATTF